MAVLVVLLAGAAFGVWWILRADASRHAPRAARPPCAHSSASTAPTRAAIRIRVLNATSRQGLASMVAAQLRLRGYTVTGVGNDPGTVPGTAELRFGPAGAPAAKSMAGLVARGVSRPVSRAGTDVDLVLGDKFTRLGVAAAPAVSPAATGCPATGMPAR